MPQKKESNKIYEKYYQDMNEIKKVKLARTKKILADFENKSEEIEKDYYHKKVNNKNIYDLEVTKLKNKKEEIEKVIPIVVNEHEVNTSKLKNRYDVKFNKDKEDIVKQNQNEILKVTLNKEYSTNKLEENHRNEIEKIDKKIKDLDKIVSNIKNQTKSNNEGRKLELTNEKNLKIKSLENKLSTEKNNLKNIKDLKNKQITEKFEKNQSEVVESMLKEQERKNDFIENKKLTLESKIDEIEDGIRLKYKDEIQNINLRNLELHKNLEKEIIEKEEIYDSLKKENLKMENELINKHNKIIEYEENLLNRQLNLDLFLKNNKKALEYKSEKDLLDDIFSKKTSEISDSDFEEVDAFIEKSIQNILLENKNNTEKDKDELEKIKKFIEIYEDKLNSRKKELENEVVQLKVDYNKFNNEKDVLEKQLKTEDNEEFRKMKDKLILEEKTKIDSLEKFELDQLKNKFENEVKNLNGKYKEEKTQLKNKIDNNKMIIKNSSVKLSEKITKLNDLDKDLINYKNNIDLNKNSDFKNKINEINKLRENQISKLILTTKKDTEQVLNQEILKKNIDKEKLQQNFEVEKLKVSEMDYSNNIKIKDISKKIEEIEKDNSIIDSIINTKNSQITDYLKNYNNYVSETRTKNQHDYLTEKEMIKKTVSGKKFEYDIKTSGIKSEIENLNNKKADFIVILTSNQLNDEGKVHVLSSINQLDTLINNLNEEIKKIDNEFSNKINEANLLEDLNIRYIENDSKIEESLNSQINLLKEDLNIIETSKQKNELNIINFGNELKSLQQKSDVYQSSIIEAMEIELNKELNLIESNYNKIFEKSYDELYQNNMKNINKDFDILIQEQTKTEIDKTMIEYNKNYQKSKDIINTDIEKIKSETSEIILKLPELENQYLNFDLEKQNEDLINNFNINSKEITNKYLDIKNKKTKELENNYDNSKMLSNLSEIELKLLNLDQEIRINNSYLKNIDKEKKDNQLIDRKEYLEEKLNNSQIDLIKNIEKTNNSKEFMIQERILFEKNKINEQFSKYKNNLESLYRNTVEIIKKDEAEIQYFKNLKNTTKNELNKIKEKISDSKLKTNDLNEYIEASKIDYNNKKNEISKKLLEINDNIEKEIQINIENEKKKIDDQLKFNPMLFQFEPDKLIDEFNKIKNQEVSNNEKIYKIDLEKVEKEYEDNLNEINKNHNKDVNNLYEELITTIVKVDNELIPDLERQKDDKKIKINLYNIKKEELLINYNKQIKKLDIIHQENFKKLTIDNNSELEKEISNLNKNFIETMNNLDFKYDDKINELNIINQKDIENIDIEYHKKHLDNKNNYESNKMLEINNLKSEIEKLEDVFKQELYLQ